jgi:hypothetical protein
VLTSAVVCLSLLIVCHFSHVPALFDQLNSKNVVDRG